MHAGRYPAGREVFSSVHSLDEREIHGQEDRLDKPVPDPPQINSTDHDWQIGNGMRFSPSMARLLYNSANQTMSQRNTA